MELYCGCGSFTLTLTSRFNKILATENNRHSIRLLKESIKLNIPNIAILDTNSNPEGIDFPIPGNDDARRSIDLYCSLIKETIENAQKETPKAEDKKITEKPKKQETSTPKKKLN